ncbi:MAG TPA: SDR family oxidoreductase [Phycisphaerales bacterium]|nr:SDR family oxidoreductase [Phycisphaerales bacterium]
MSEHSVAVVTGAGSGIGRATAVMLGERGYAVVLVGRGREALRETAELVDSETMVLAADIGLEDSAEAVVSGTLDAFGRIDALINNAAMAPMAPLADSGWAQLAALYRVNAIGPTALIARAWPAMAGQHRAAGTIARIVNVSSMSAIDPFPGLSSYGATKGALNVLTRGCANEGREAGIRAFAVAPGSVETAMLRAIAGEDLVPRTATLTPEQVAGVIVACAAGERDEENGAVIVVPSA